MRGERGRERGRVEQGRGGARREARGGERWLEAAESCSEVVNIDKARAWSAAWDRYGDAPP